MVMEPERRALDDLIHEELVLHFLVPLNVKV